MKTIFSKMNLLALIFCLGFTVIIKAQPNRTQLSGFGFSLKGIKGFCDSTVNQRWTGTGWTLTSLSAIHLNTAGYVNGIVAYDSNVNMSFKYDLLLTTNNKIYKGNSYINKASYKLGTGMGLYGYIVADTNSAGIIILENSFSITDTSFKNYGPNERYIYNYDKNGVMLGAHKLAYNQKTGWEVKHSDSFDYNASGQLITDNYYGVNSSTLKLELQNRKSYTYKSNGKVDVELGEYYDPNNSKWISSSRNTNTYDASDRKIISFSESYMGSSGWVKGGIDSTSFDVNGYSITMKYNYDATNKKWVLKSRDICGYVLTSSGPAAPSGLTVIKIKKMNDKKLQLSWTDNSSDESGFIIYRSTDGINWMTIDSAAMNATSYIDSGLVDNTTYYYTVSSWNSSGVSSKSNSANATTYTSINYSTDNIEFRIFPNPSNGIINLNTSGNIKEGTIIIRDELGKVVYHNIVSSGMTSMSIQLENVPAGLYIISIQGTDYKYIQKISMIR